MKRQLVWIDDDFDIINALVRRIEQEGHQVQRMRTAAEAWRALDRVLACDLLILDILLPVGSGAGPSVKTDQFTGRTLLAQLRAEHGFDRPVIVCTVVRLDEIADELKALGVDAILNKTETTAARLKQVADEIWARREGTTDRR